MAAFRVWLENLIPWYDREAEERASRRTEAIRRKSINARIYSEAVRAEHRLRQR